MISPLISVQRVSKSFGRIKALKDISFEIKGGEIVGFLGPNGAGKTTMMRLITGLFLPSEGRILMKDQDMSRAKPELRRKIGYLAERNPLYHDMTAREFLSFVAQVKGIPFGVRKRAVQKVVEQCGVGTVFRRIICKLSRGFQQRLGLAQALLGDPELLILDEPTNGLDPQQIVEIRSLIRTLGRDRTVLLSTHILPEVQMTCQQVLILNGGRLVASGSPEALEGNMRESQEFLVSIRGDWRGGDQLLQAIPDILNIKLEGERGDIRDYRLWTRTGSEVRSQIARLIMEAGFELLELKAAHWSLEDIFLKIVTRETMTSGTVLSKQVAVNRL